MCISDTNLTVPSWKGNELRLFPIFLGVTDNHNHAIFRDIASNNWRVSFGRYFLFSLVLIQNQ